MSRVLPQEVAVSLGTTPDLLPYIGELLADCWALGSYPAIVVDLLRPLGLPVETTRVLDVACGKGPIAVSVARDLGFAVFGVDAFQPFVDEARDRARRAGVSDLCHFECGDMQLYLEYAKGYDVVVYAGLGPTIGDQDAITRLRNCVHTRGYVIIDDGFLAESVATTPSGYSGYEDYGGHAGMLHRLTAHGDRVVREVIRPREVQVESDRRDIALIQRRADEVARRCPQVANAVWSYVARQRQECQYLEDVLVGATWLIQRLEDSPSKG